MVPKFVRQRQEGPGVPGDTRREAWKRRLPDMVTGADAAFFTGSAEAVHLTLLPARAKHLYCVTVTRDSRADEDLSGFGGGGGDQNMNVQNKKIQVKFNYHLRISYTSLNDLTCILLSVNKNL